MTTSSLTKTPSNPIDNLDIQNQTKSELVASLRLIKNTIIGNPTKKHFYIQNNISQMLVGCLEKYPNDPNMLYEVAPIIGSLAQVNHIILLESGVLSHLLSALVCKDLKVVEVCARALRAILNHKVVLSGLINVKTFLNIGYGCFESIQLFKNTRSSR